MSRTIKRLIFWNRRSCSSVRSRRCSSSLNLDTTTIIAYSAAARRKVFSVCSRRSDYALGEEINCIVGADLAGDIHVALFALAKARQAVAEAGLAFGLHRN